MVAGGDRWTGARRVARALLAVVATILWLLATAHAPAARAQPMEPPAGAALPANDRDATLFLAHRRIATLRVTVLGDTPAERASLAAEAFEAALAAGGPGEVARTPVGDAVRFEIDGRTVFFLVAADLPGARPGALLDDASREVERRLRAAVDDARERGDARRLAIGAAAAAAATGIAWVALRLLFGARRRVEAMLDARIERWHVLHAGKPLAAAYGGSVRDAARWLAAATSWLLAVLTIDLWAIFVLNRFAYTRAWGERATTWLLDVLEQFALAAAGAVPGLLTAGLIFVIARVAARTVDGLARRVQRGDLRLGWLDADTAAPTRWIAGVVIWLFALAMAYPYLPGANSEAFKGVTVLAGLMLSIGASGMVGQAMSGLSLMYARALRVGEHVRIGEVEGTVTAVGMFATKIHTGMGEEVSLPNSVIAGLPVRNFSRLVQDGRFVLHTAVTIGYSTPWRQVHAMLLEAARRTPGVAPEPAPYVVQTALSDFYVEYRLCAQGDKSAPRRRAEAMGALHANIQDVFNEQGVQIMSPHYMADPPEPQVVPPGAWGPARATGPARDDAPSP